MILKTTYLQQTIRVTLYVLITPLFFTSVWAQSAKPSKLLPPPAKIYIDGNIEEWGDSLRYYNAEKNINYAIANTADTLYMAIRITDPVEKRKALRAGITFGIDTKGKKKETYSITYPVSTSSTNNIPLTGKPDEQNADISQEDRNDLERQRLTTLRGIKADGFKDIDYDLITTSNTYGIRAGINYDEAGNLDCEIAVPIKFFHVDDITKNEWAFNFKINGLTRPEQHPDGDQIQPGGHKGGGMGGSGRGGMGGGGRGGRGGQHSAATEEGQGEMFKADEFWEKYYLAK